MNAQQPNLAGRNEKAGNYVRGQKQASGKGSRSRKQPLPVLIALSTLLLLAACNKTPGPPLGTPDLTTKTELNFTGGPISNSGETTPLSLELQVANEDGTPVHFNHEGVADDNGDLKQITVPTTESSARIWLPSGLDYSFTATASDADGHILAVADAQRNITGTGMAVVMNLQSLLGKAELVPRMPITQLVPGQVIDLVFSITPPQREDLRVPDRDFEVTYAGTGTVLNFSHSGVRVEIGSREDGDATVTATANGLTLTGDTVSNSDITAVFQRPFTTGLEVDAQPPEVNSLAFDANQHVLAGVAVDDRSITRLDVYDGPVLLATTDLKEAAARDIPVVRFPGGGTAFLVQLELPSGSYELTVKATDFSGNEATGSLNVIAQ